MLKKILYLLARSSAMLSLLILLTFCLNLFPNAYSSEPSNNYAPINGSCIGLKCGQSAGCFRKHQCTCHFGFYNDPQEDIYNCRPIQCRSNHSLCTKHFSHSKCNDNSCVCIWKLHIDTQRCKGPPNDDSADARKKMMYIAASCIIAGAIIALGIIGHRKRWFHRTTVVRRTFVSA